MKNILVFKNCNINMPGVQFPEELPITLNFGHVIYGKAKMSREGEDIIADFPMEHPLPQLYYVAPGGKVLERKGDVITKYEIFEVSLIPKMYLKP